MAAITAHTAAPIDAGYTAAPKTARRMAGAFPMGCVSTIAGAVSDRLPDRGITPFRERRPAPVPGIQGPQAEPHRVRAARARGRGGGELPDTEHGEPRGLRGG